MPLRKQRVKRATNEHDIEVLRRAIGEGLPWRLHVDDRFQQGGLETRHAILLSYVCNIPCGIAVFLAGNPHPSQETVRMLKKELKDDIRQAEKRFKGIFKGERRNYNFFAELNYNSVPREFF